MSECVVQAAMVLGEANLVAGWFRVSRNVELNVHFVVVAVEISMEQ